MTIGSLVIVTTYTRKPIGIIVSHSSVDNCFIVFISSLSTRRKCVDVHKKWLKEIAQ